MTAANSYTVTVIATDPKGIPTEDATDEDNEDFRGTVVVMITVTPVDEPPIFTVTSDLAFEGVFTNVGKFAAVSFDETTGINVVEDDDEIGIALATFMADDPETATTTTLGIRGADSSKFTINANGELKFKAAPAAVPNFEKPVDADKDNVYEVTITATDGNANMATRDVKVTVTNAEEAGKVTLSQPRPRVGVAITAGYSDPDGGLASATWQWWRTDSNTLGVGNAPDVPANTDLTDLDDSTVWGIIEDATSATYMPVVDDEAEDSDVGRYLLAVVSYTDAKQNVGEAKDIAGLVSVNPVAKDTRNRAPVFGDQDSDTPGTQNQSATREVAENTKAKANVGSAVIAEDPDPNADPLVYALSGADAGLFTVASPGQIKVKSGTKLDYEAAKNVYMVTLTARDSFGESASIDVTITVTDVDEGPKISEGGLAITGSVSVDYAEDRRDAVATYSATGPESANASWTLGGDDAGDFAISSSGALTFVSAPDYENAADADGDNVYMVTVKADDGTYMDTHDVMVRVTNEDEPGRVTFWRDGADATNAAIMVGDELSGAVDDSDGNPGDAFPIAMYKRIAAANVTFWQWAKSMTPDMMDSWMDIGTGGMYTVMDDDQGYYLRATAVYTDGEGSGKSAREVSANAVAAEGTGDPLLAKYDTSGNGKIDLDEALGAVATYFAISRSDALPEAKAAAEVEVLDVVARYFSDRRGAS